MLDTASISESEIKKPDPGFTDLIVAIKSLEIFAGVSVANGVTPSLKI